MLLQKQATIWDEIKRRKSSKFPVCNRTWMNNRWKNTVSYPINNFLCSFCHVVSQSYAKKTKITSCVGARRQTRVSRNFKGTSLGKVRRRGTYPTGKVTDGTSLSVDKSWIFKLISVSEFGFVEIILQIFPSRYGEMSGQVFTFTFWLRFHAPLPTPTVNTIALLQRATSTRSVVI